MSIKRSIVQGSVLIGTTQIVQYCARFITALFLVRYLLPEDFGSMALIYSVFSFIDALKMVPLNKVIIQKKNVDGNAYSTVFWFNLIKDIIVGVFLLAAVSFMPFSLPVKQVLYLFSLKIFFDSFAFMPICILEKNLKFKKMAIIYLGEIVIYAISVILCVYWGLGIVSFGVAVLIQYIFRSLLSFLFSEWFPRLFISLKSVMSFRDFSLYYYFMRILKYGLEKSEYYFIALLSTLGNVGLFYIATEITNIVLNPFHIIAARALYPAFSIISNDDNGLRRYYLICLQYLLCGSVAFYGSLIVLAPRCAAYFLTGLWQEIMIPFQILAVSGIAKPVSLLIEVMLIARGDIRDIFRCNYFTALIRLILIWLGIKGGLIGVAIAISVFEVLFCFILVYFSSHRLHISLSVIFIYIMRPLSFILAGIGLLFMCTFFLPQHFLITFGLIFIVFAIYGTAGFYQLRSAVRYFSSDKTE
ncbi:MAG: oligosaccharide flippase family protein [Candidatus Omnitrophica bacterium]|nr:oligosaccharide flippase family protein [Candidatus Omnitrophota bacterium]